MKPIKLLLTICCVVLAITLAGCKSSAGVIPPTTTEIKNLHSEKEIVHDTLKVVEKDSSFYRAYLECVNGKVQIKPPKETPLGAKPPSSQKGKNLNAPKVNIKDNVLEVDCVAEAQKIFWQWKEKWISDHKETTIKIPYPVKVPLSDWQSFQIWCGRIFLALLILFIGAGILRYKNII
jgi:hypothetical protein